jgi:hypothetical protein
LLSFAPILGDRGPPPPLLVGFTFKEEDILAPTPTCGVCFEETAIIFIFFDPPAPSFSDPLSADDVVLPDAALPVVLLADDVVLADAALPFTGAVLAVAAAFTGLVDEPTLPSQLGERTCFDVCGTTMSGGRS